MANLKIDLKVDLINKLNNDKYYEELELIRLASDANMNYKRKIELMSNSLLNISELNSQIGLAGQYFQEPTVVQATQGTQGQSHSE